MAFSQVSLEPGIVYCSTSKDYFLFLFSVWKNCFIYPEKRMLRRFLFALSKYLKNIIEKVDSILKGALWEEKKKKRS